MKSQLLLTRRLGYYNRCVGIERRATGRELVSVGSGGLFCGLERKCA